MNIPPQVNGSSVFMIMVGQESTYNIQANDSDEFTLKHLGDLPGQLISHGNGAHSFTVNLSHNETLMNNETVSFVATDSMNATTLLNPQVHLCACQYGGNCTLDGVQNRNIDPVILNCICPEGWLIV